MPSQLVERLLDKNFSEQSLLEFEEDFHPSSEGLWNKAKEIAESTATEKKRIVESAKRKDLINDMIQPLAKDQREIMIDLLESVQTGRLKAQFDKYLPAVIDGNTPAKKAKTLTEGKEITGNRENTNASSQQADVDTNDNVVNIKRLAGLN